MTATNVSAQSVNPHVGTVERILDEAAGMFRAYVGGPGFWRYAHEAAELEGVRIEETFDMSLFGPRRVSFTVEGKNLNIMWTPPSN
ncbi:MAG: hypothetical protein KBD16_03655 [Candidatus Pacebacteria bacterium]|nr:hypothetical protein [Candidatus Paceibacterota bacterium]